MTVAWYLQKAPITQPLVGSDELAAHLWQVGTDVDTVTLNQLSIEAQDYIESHTNTMFTPRQCSLTVDRFPIYWLSLNQIGFNMGPLPAGLVLPVWPVYSLISITYYDINQTLYTITPDQLQLRNSQPPAVFPYPGTVWPFSQPQKVSNVTVTFNGGYGGVNPPPPPLVKRAIKMLATHWYLNREIAHQALLQEMPFGLKTLIRDLDWWE